MADARFKVRVEVRLRKNAVDPEAETVKKSLIDLDFPVSQVRTAKVYEVVLDSKSRKEAESVGKLICSRLLVNPIKDDYKLEMMGEEQLTNDKDRGSNSNEVSESSGASENPIDAGP